ncbi:MAG: hypothetical protein L3J36_13835 [Rhodobacteraceae bacterium]|nr:hypothetical protein [Paracoccaceae bacterium]
MKRLAVLALVMLPGNALAEDWWQGVWASDPEWCAEAETVGTVTPAPIVITATEVLGYESSCDITEVQRMDHAQAVYLRLSCQSEGSRFDEDRLLMRADESGLVVWIWFGSGDPDLFQYCQ